MAKPVENEATSEAIGAGKLKATLKATLLARQL